MPMQDDLVTALTRQVREEVVENYIRERRLIELQIEQLDNEADQTRAEAVNTGTCLSELSALMIGPEMKRQLASILRLPPSNGGAFWLARLLDENSKTPGPVRVRALTQRGKFRKLVVESYSRVYERMKKYRAFYEDLGEECKAVNGNITAFQNNFDLLSILSFFRNLDVVELERKKILGGNFTAGELSQLDRNLHINQISMEKFDVPPPLELPQTRHMEDRLSGLSEEVFRKYSIEVRAILK